MSMRTWAAAGVAAARARPPANIARRDIGKLERLIVIIGKIQSDASVKF
jgi:hypothetical protein